MAVADEEAPPPLYRTARTLPFELVQHVGIFFEEKLYTQALNLLLNIITTGTILPAPVYVPSPQHLALAATFLVHPSTTTRAKTAEQEEASNVSLRLLRLANTLAGPVSAKLGTAFSFTHFEASRHGRRRRAEDEQPADDDTKPLNLDLAQSASLWSRAEDFWHAVGWAFNCSVLHHERWEKWQIWLEYMCEVLEDDWNERKRMHDRTSNTDDKALKDSLIFRYITETTAGYGRNRRILRAIFADGGSSASNEFREIFHHELKKPKQDKNTKKREVQVNIDEEQYGDYLTDDDDDSSDNNTKNDPDTASKRPTRQTKRPRRGTRAKDAKSADAVDTKSAVYALSDVSSHGGFQSLALRQRLLHLLSGVAEALPDAFTPLEELYHLFVENIRHLPLPVFQALIAPSTLPYFSLEARTTLCEYLLFRIRESAAPDTDEEYLNQAKLEECFLPYAASTSSVVDNTKMSILLETLLILLANSDMLKVTTELQEAVEEGIQRRAEKAQMETKKSASARKTEDAEWCWLLESGERLRFLAEEVLPRGEDSD
ncbi:hypothetical protein BDV38DRAFT_107207 [Aspergillus pseudotamarii]|uniref:Uncharacterized protein n=1 Tax=Aspergillus pseudotamarii TaxID=132259 RepID=A0A5N6SS53_ASPPS|nr:uncharacterized protein BDV38DRAFT_107207 [Aspergillus pseudotamarii]KAE8136679.1 hypothetical protein BDV38DRAFT_107207 [Aspergillus pseudotamarii]